MADQPRHPSTGQYQNMPKLKNLPPLEGGDPGDTFSSVGVGSGTDTPYGDASAVRTGFSKLGKVPADPKIGEHRAPGEDQTGPGTF